MSLGISKFSTVIDVEREIHSFRTFWKGSFLAFQTQSAAFQLFFNNSDLIYSKPFRATEHFQAQVNVITRDRSNHCWSHSIQRVKNLQKQDHSRSELRGEIDKLDDISKT